jgi:ATPase subunit of ABC transporter with duplicated ATPase domains
MVVSHDITLLNLLDTTYELSTHGIKLYGGCYDFYREQKNIEASALQESIDAEEKALRIAQKKAKEVKERQEKRIRQGEKNKLQLVRSLRKKKLNAGENTAAKLGDKHSKIIGNHRSMLSELRQKQDNLGRLKTNFNNSSLHANKLLIRTNSINFAYDGKKELWSEPIELKIFSNDRIRLMGNNGSGKTTLIKLLLGELIPTSGTIDRAEFNHVYLDQSYKQMDLDCSIAEMAENYNTQHLEEHEVKIRLNRFLFPPDTWDKKCAQLSGGEKMRLYLCCLMISNHTPDIIILDEPTNNLDIASLEIITNTIRDYRGCLLVISHDSYFINEIGIAANLKLPT